MNEPTELETVLRASLLYEELKKEVFQLKRKKLPPWFQWMSCDDWIRSDRKLMRQNPHAKQHERD